LRRHSWNTPDSLKDAFAPVLMRGVVAAWPICLGYGAVGLAFGVLAANSGFAVWQIGLMSLLVYAGSSQFVAVAMAGSGMPAPAVILTTFTINLRHLLMSSSLAPHLKEMDRKWQPLFAYGITDESFAVNMTRFAGGNWGWPEALVLNHTANFAWILSTMAGGYTGQFVPPGAFGIDYALTAMFICLLIFQFKDYRFVLVAALAGILALFLSFLIERALAILIGSFLASPLGLFFRWNSDLKEDR